MTADTPSASRPVVPEDLPNSLVVDRWLPARLQLSLYLFELSRHRVMLLVNILVLAMGIAAIVMLCMGGPLPWYWCAAWIVAVVWSFWSPVKMMAAGVATARSRWVPGQTVRSGFDAHALWIKAERGGWRYSFERTTYAGKLGRVVFLGVDGGRRRTAIPASLFQDGGTSARQKFEGPIREPDSTSGSRGGDG